MNRILIPILFILCFNATSLLAMTDSRTDSLNGGKPVFTVLKEIPVTSVRNQFRSGTCWDFSSLSFLEAEILRKTGKVYDLCESFILNKNYMDRAVMTVRLHGDMDFSEGGSPWDVQSIIATHGICPEDAMPLPGTLCGDSLYDFGEFFSVMTPYVKGVAKTTDRLLSPAWVNGLQGILDAYLGKTPETFVFEGRTYTPKSFAQSLPIDLDDYVCITSFTHHPFWTQFAIEVQNNWRQGMAWNVPMEDMAVIIDNAIENGYTVEWVGDVSEDGFTYDGLAVLASSKDAAEMSGSDMAKWLKLAPTQRKAILHGQGVNVVEDTPSQEARQREFDNWSLTADHCMLIYGKAKDQNGREYYMVQNSWGEAGDYKGIWYMSRNYLLAKTLEFTLNKNALPKAVTKRLHIPTSNN